MERFTHRDEKGLTRPTKIAEKFLEPDDGSNACRLLSKIGEYEDKLEQYEKLEEQPKDNTIEILRKFFNNHKEFRIVKNSKENKFGLKLANDYDYITDYNFSGNKKDFELECFVHNISEDLFNALKEIGVYVEEEN